MAWPCAPVPSPHCARPRPERSVGAPADRVQRASGYDAPAASADACHLLTKANVTSKGGNSVTPVLANGRLYVRSAKSELVCLDVSGK